MRVRTISGLLSATLVTAGLASVVFAPASYAAACTNNWQGPTSGVQQWSTAANWSGGVPTSSDAVCIKLAGTYTVDLTSSTTVGSIAIGATTGTQTLEVDGASTNIELNLASTSTNTIGAHGALVLAPTSSGYTLLGGGSGAVVTNSGAFSTTGVTGAQPAYLRVNLTNAAAGTVDIGAPNTAQDSATLTSNSGTFTVSSGGQLNLTGASGFTNAAGSLAVNGGLAENSGTFTASGGAQSGNPVILTGGTLADSGTTGAFTIQGGMSLTGNIPAGQTVTVDGSVASVNVNVSGATTLAGTLAMTPAGGYALLGGSGSLMVASGGTLSSSNAAASQPAYLRIPITNNTGGTVSLGAPDNRLDSGTLTSNSGTFTVNSGAQLALTASSSFTNAAGTLTVNGGFAENGGTFTASGGTETGNPVILTGGTLADGHGTGAFTVQGNASLTGNIPVGQSVIVDGSANSITLTLPGATTLSGTLALTPGAGFTILGGTGPLTVASAASLTSSNSGASQPAYLRVPITNKAGGTVKLGAPINNQDSSTLTSNSGTFTVASGAQFNVAGGSSFTNAAGKLTVNGGFAENSGTFTASGGIEAGNPVIITSATLADGQGSGAFKVQSNTNLTGNIPAGQSVTVDGSVNNVSLTLPGATTVSGTLAMDPRAASPYSTGRVR